jgi:hypothetical protein
VVPTYRSALTFSWSNPSYPSDFSTLILAVHQCWLVIPLAFFASSTAREIGWPAVGARDYALSRRLDQPEPAANSPNRRVPERAGFQVCDHARCFSRRFN